MRPRRDRPRRRGSLVPLVAGQAPARDVWGRDLHTKMNSFSASSPESLDLLPCRPSLLGDHGFWSWYSWGCGPQLLLQTETEVEREGGRHADSPTTPAAQRRVRPARREDGVPHARSQKHGATTWRDSDKRETTQQRQTCRIRKHTQLQPVRGPSGLWGRIGGRETHTERRAGGKGGAWRRGALKPQCQVTASPLPQVSPHSGGEGPGRQPRVRELRDSSQTGGRWGLAEDDGDGAWSRRHRSSRFIALLTTARRQAL